MDSGTIVALLCTMYRHESCTKYLHGGVYIV